MAMELIKQFANDPEFKKSFNGWKDKALSEMTAFHGEIANKGCSGIMEVWNTVPLQIRLAAVLLDVKEFVL